MARAKDIIHDLSRLPHCCFCGGRSTDAVWRGKRTIGVCMPCAREILPKLIADAIANRMPAQRETLEQVISTAAERTELEFRRAMDHNVSVIFEEWRQLHRQEVN